MLLIFLLSILKKKKILMINVHGKHLGFVENSLSGKHPNPE